MAEFPNKFQNMVDEMNRFEEEIGLPYRPEMRPGPGRIPSQPFVLGTNTFSQAQRKILQINHGDELIPVNPNVPSFIPAQVLHAPQSGGIPPPPPPPLSMPPAGMRFPPGIPIPYSQPITAPPSTPVFSNPLMMRPETVANSAAVSSASSVVAAAAAVFRRPTATWAPRSIFKPPVPKPETKPVEETPKVVLSATPKLYTPKVDKAEDLETTSMGSRLVGVDIPKSNNDNLVKKLKPNETSKYTPVASYISAIEAAQADRKKDRKQKKFIRVSGGTTWEDPTLTEWDDGDFRLFAGDLGNDVTDELLTRIFSRYPSFSKAKVVRDKRTNKTKGFGFISFKDPQDFIKASKEMNGRYVGSRPIKLRKSTWKNRNIDVVKKKEKEKAALLAMLTGKS